MLKFIKKSICILSVALLAVATAIMGGCDSTVRINGTEAANYTIVYAEAGTAYEKEFAKTFAQCFADETGIELEVKSDATPKSDYEIRFGEVKRDNAHKTSELENGKYAIKSDDGSLTLLGSNTSAMLSATRDLIGKLGNKGITVGDVTDTATNYGVDIMSFNLRTKDKDLAREKRVYEKIRDVSPSSFGVQEGTDSWMQSLSREFKDEYSFVGLARNGKEDGDETASIFYKTTEFECVEWGTKWLGNVADKPSKAPAGSDGMGNDGYYRIVTYALLKRKSDGLVYVHANTHLDMTARGRLYNIKKLLEIIKPYSDLYPTFITGDFNDFGDGRQSTDVGSSEETDPALNYNIMKYMEESEPDWNNSRFTCPATDGDKYTYPTRMYYDDLPDGREEKLRIIDYCYYKPAGSTKLFADSYRVLDYTCTDGKWASDHHPVTVGATLFAPITVG